jgi:primary-amine oxidase
MGLLSKPVLATALLLSSLLSNLALARPSPEPKSSWARKKKLANNIKRAAGQPPLSQPQPLWRRDNETVACAEALATTITAPYTNVWGELTDAEAASVVSWLFAQPELNLTTTENSTAWDNTV